MKQIALLSITILLSMACDKLNAQKVKNISPQLVNDQMVITFDVVNAKFNQEFEVELFVSTDGDSAYSGPMTLVVDTTKDILPGTNEITWDIFQDLNTLDSKLSFDVRIHVEELDVKRKLFIQYSAAMLMSSTDYITPFGFRIGMAGKTGWYLAGYFNTFANADYDYTNGELNRDIIYEFSNKVLYPRSSILAGVTHQVGWKTHLFAGVGYGTKKYYTGVNELYGDGSIKKESYANYTEHDKSGPEIEVGILYNYKWLSSSLGISTFNFTDLGLSFGIGYTF